MSGAGFEVRGLTKHYGGPAALLDVSCTFVVGQHTAILGPSGCGKSTLLRILAGLEAPSAGRVLLRGQLVSEPGRIVLPPHQRSIAMVFQDLALWPNLSVAENVLLGLAGARLNKQQARKRAEETLELCGIADLAQRKPGSISGGQQQRVALARALAARPAFLLLDEPFGGLDLVVKTRLLRELAQLATRQQLTIVLVTHDPLEATTLCRCAVVLGNTGRVEESGPLTDLLQNPRSEMLKVLREHMREVASLPG